MKKCGWAYHPPAFYIKAALSSTMIWKLGIFFVAIGIAKLIYVVIKKKSQGRKDDEK